MSFVASARRAGIRIILEALVVLAFAFLFALLQGGMPKAVAVDSPGDALGHMAHSRDRALASADPRAAADVELPSLDRRPGSAGRGQFVATSGLRVAANSEHSLFARARMDRLLNPERGSIGGLRYTGRTTSHGAERMAEAGFDDIDVAILRAGQSYEQTDGATAFVTSAGRNTYNMIVQNSDGAIVTAHRGMSFDDLSGLAQNYGWSGW